MHWPPCCCRTWTSPQRTDTPLLDDMSAHKKMRTQLPSNFNDDLFSLLFGDSRSPTHADSDDDLFSLLFGDSRSPTQSGTAVSIPMRPAPLPIIVYDRVESQQKAVAYLEQHGRPPPLQLRRYLVT